MKRILLIGALAVVFTLGTSWRNTASAQVNIDISYQTFYDELSPYGDWIDYPDYGYVWVPSERNGFRPYETNGHWVWTDDYGWMWASDYSWGWAAFHYGRWFYDPFYGWMWVPGYEWSPAWVAWRDGGDYYGWAPLRPGINISVGFSIGSYNPPMDYWVFAPRRYISSPRIYDYCVDRSRNITIINNTTIINNYNRRNNVFITGPRRVDAERYAGRINPVRFRESSRPGRSQFRNNEVSVYRPRVQQSENRRFAPRNFERYDRSRSQSNGVVRRDNNFNQRNGNNLPQSGEGNRFDRRNNNGNNDNRAERRNIFEGQGNQQRNDGRFERQQQVERQNQQRQFERQQQAERQNQQRQVERQQQFERQNQQRQFERQQQAERQNQQRQVERQQQSQTRQFERRQENQQRQMDRGDRGGNDNKGRGQGRRF